MSKDIIDSEDDFDVSDDENQQSFALKKNRKDLNTLQQDHESESDNDGNEAEDEGEVDEKDDNQDDFLESLKSNTEHRKGNTEGENNTVGNDEDGDTDAYNVAVDVDDDDDQYFGYLSGEDEETDLNNIDKEVGGEKSGKKTKVKKLTAEQLAKEEKKIKKSGVVYLSSLPPYMKPQKLRHIMSKFGEVGRIFLKPEDPKVYKSRIKSGGNKKKKFEEGWVEFVSKKDAKLAAETLNGNILGGKKRSFYHDDVMNVKYLKGFKWFDLTNALNREVEVRENKKQAELSQAHKINKAFIKNVETSKTINRVKDSKKRKIEKGDENTTENFELRRNFKQRNVVTHRAEANEDIKSKTEGSKINSVLDKIF